jgi:hypothetical protein
VRGVLKVHEERNAHDAYFTPAPLALSICEALKRRVQDPLRILVPGAGEGAFVKAAAETWPSARVSGLDIEPRLAGMLKADFLTFAGSRSFDLVLGNPPFERAEAFVHQAFEHVVARGHVAFLLRLSFLGSQGRARSLWPVRGLRWLAPIVPRPSFSSDGATDASEYGLFVWQREPLRREARILPPLEWSRKP